MECDKAELKQITKVTWGVSSSFLYTGAHTPKNKKSPAKLSKPRSFRLLMYLIHVCHPFKDKRVFEFCVFFVSINSFFKLLLLLFFFRSRKSMFQ